MDAKKNKFVFVLSLFLCLAGNVWSDSTHIIPIDSSFLPVIESLSNRIPVPEEKRSIQNYAFKDYTDDVTRAYRQNALGESLPQQFYRYTANDTDTIQSLAARLNIPQETLATANAIESPDTPIAGKTLFLPTVPGLFVPLKPKSALGILLAKENAPIITEQTPCYALDGRAMYFLQDARFTPTQRVFFLDTSMKMPLTDSVLTSDFGYRVSPISNTWKFHSGVDLAAPTGTPVYACKRGTVQTILKNDAVFGNCIIVQHANGLTSVYAHLSSILTKKGDTVSTGTQIGTVGTTGASTGPHLHFEVRQNGKPTNPLKK